MSERPTIDELRVTRDAIVSARAARVAAALVELELVLADIKRHEAELIACDKEEARLRSEIVAIGGEAALRYV